MPGRYRYSSPASRSTGIQGLLKSRRIQICSITYSPESFNIKFFAFGSTD